MATTRTFRGLWLCATATVALTADPTGWTVRSAFPCGGFFCNRVQVDQTGERIIFRRDGSRVTAIVQILYTGPSEQFSWVVPVPGIPEVSLASDLLFAPLDQATRPRFTLDVQGSPCQGIPIPVAVPVLPLAAAAGPALEDAGGSVTVLQQQSVGPFDVQVVHSTDPNAMATWLTDHGYNVSDRGRELLHPYVEVDMNFVAVRLQKDRTSGEIQPLKMVYDSTQPMIPIQLTAVASQPDLDVTVWLLGEGRAVPLNYPHVKVNYARLNWYQGDNAAYASYKSLVTAAMNEVGGQGFATDYAGHDGTVLEALPQPRPMRDELERLAALADAADAIAGVTNGTVFLASANQIRGIFQRALPLPAGAGLFLYQDASGLRNTFSADVLSAARVQILEDIRAEVVVPLENALGVFDANPYMTRVYTTLSPDEMTVDPIFSFNPGLPDQPIERHALLTVNCVLGQTQWSLTLGPGTGRDGAIVLQGRGLPPVGVPSEVSNQPAFKTTETMRETGLPEMLVDNDLPAVFVLSAEAPPVHFVPVYSLCGAVPLPLSAFTVLVIVTVRRPGRRRKF